MPGYLYILECADGSLYVGSTRDIDRRVDQHNSGRGAQYTSRRLPVRLVYCLPCESVAEAYALEKRVHSWSRAKRLALIDGTFEDLPELARKRFRRR
ncbi:GIY-YIG nuclease family protein [Gordonia sp. CPCC 206044]|uniref:GIY-YIG nuclease family protein n=1 Tax=Gordonia sp. CPCC 206044 TaxID=3140793 RepID=UPI003AF3F598